MVLSSKGRKRKDGYTREERKMRDRETLHTFVALFLSLSVGLSLDRLVVDEAVESEKLNRASKSIVPVLTERKSLQCMYTTEKGGGVILRQNRRTCTLSGAD